MKKLLTPFIIALALVLTISSCKKPVEKQVGESMFGSYSGDITGDLRVLFPSANIEIDTTFLAPGVAATGILAATSYDDSLSLNLKMTVDGTAIDITVLAAIDSETTFTVPSRIFKYLGAVPILVSGSGTISGNDGDIHINLAEPSGATTAIFGDLDFKGSK